MARLRFHILPLLSLRKLQVFDLEQNKKSLEYDNRSRRPVTESNFTNIQRSCDLIRNNPRLYRRHIILKSFLCSFER